VCTVAGLRPVILQKNTAADVALALGPQFAEVKPLADPNGERGVLFYDAIDQIAGLVIVKKSAGMAAVSEELDGRTKLNGVGVLSTPLTQTFTTWDQHNASVRASYDQAGTADLKVRTNAIASAFLGASLVNGLQGTAGISGPFKIQAEYVQRDSTTAVVVIALTPAGLAAQNVFNLDNIAGGSALARYVDYLASECEVFTSNGTPIVDFLWAVDNSASMGAYQAAVGATGTVFAAKLATAGIDWRAGGVTTDYDRTPANFRPFTTDPPTMQAWFSAAGATAFGTGGSGAEYSLLSAQAYVQTLVRRPCLLRTRFGLERHCT
jgi:hypothetical protein